MTVYDVVQIVSPGAMTSTPAGRWAAAFFYREEDARGFAERCRNATTVPGIDYRIKRHDEECPGRVKRPHETHAVGECTCPKAPAGA